MIRLIARRGRNELYVPLNLCQKPVLLQLNVMHEYTLPQ